ncbi:unnamed protein product [Lathyrus oleraceus]
MAYFKKVILNLAFLFVILLSMNVAATTRIPPWIIEPHHQTHGRQLNLNVQDRPRNHNYGIPPPPGANS